MGEERRLKLHNTKPEKVEGVEGRFYIQQEPENIGFLLSTGEGETLEALKACTSQMNTLWSYLACVFSSSGRCFPLLMMHVSEESVDRPRGPAWTCPIRPKMAASSPLIGSWPIAPGCPSPKICAPLLRDRPPTPLGREGRTPSFSSGIWILRMSRFILGLEKYVQPRYQRSVEAEGRDAS